ncbi:protein N-terminal asparagine amidohydrolase isoform X1 [Lampetra fluviatilis]
MPLLVGGEALGPCPSTRSFIEKHGARYQADAAALRAQPVRTVGPEGLVYLHQGEMAATEPTDDATWLLGSEEATTCHLVVLRHSGSGAVCLGHFDGSGTARGARAVVDHVLALSPTQSPGRLELHVIGGFEDERSISQRLTLDVLDAFSQQEEEIHLVTFCASELNDELREGHHWPVIYGIAVDVRAGSLFRARFPDKGPDRALRNSRNHGDNEVNGDTHSCETLLRRVPGTPHARSVLSLYCLVLSVKPRRWTLPKEPRSVDSCSHESFKSRSPLVSFVVHHPAPPISHGWLRTVRKKFQRTYIDSHTDP